jgi:hypothetical protein
MMETEQLIPLILLQPVLEHTITYTFTNAKGCTDSANDVVEVFALPAVTFTAPADLCIDAGTIWFRKRNCYWWVSILELGD